MIKSLDRGIKILDLLVERKAARMSDVASFFRISRNSAFLFLETLRINSLVEKDSKTKRYKINAGVLRYSNAFKDDSFGKIAHPFLEKLCALTKENSHCCALSGDRVLVIDQVNSQEILGCYKQLGLEEGMYCTSTGKVILAFLPDEARERIINSIELLPLTDKTISSKDILREQLKEIKVDGYALDNEENVVGVRGLAAPVRNHDGEVNSCVGISAPATRLEEDKFPDYAKIVKGIAAEISAQLGYAGGSFYGLQRSQA